MIVIKKFATFPEANLVIQGGLITGVDVSKSFEGLVGKTITFTSPAGSCTFSQPSGKPLGQLSFQDLVSQLETAITNLDVVNINGRLAFRHKTAGSAVTLGSANEPARVILGFANNVAINGQCLNGPGGSAPKFLEHVTENGSISIATEV